MNNDYTCLLKTFSCFDIMIYLRLSRQGVALKDIMTYHVWHGSAETLMYD